METIFALLVICAGIRRSLVKSPLKGHWRGALMFSLICAWTNGWVNNQDAGDLRRHRTQHGITVMELRYAVIGCDPYWSVLQLYPSRNISNQTVKVLNHAYHNRICCNNPILRFGQYNTMGHLSGLDCGSSCRHHMRTHLGKSDHGMVPPYPPMQYIFSHLTQSPCVPDRSPQFWSVCNPALKIAIHCRSQVQIISPIWHLFHVAHTAIKYMFFVFSKYCNDSRVQLCYWFLIELYEV